MATGSALRALAAVCAAILAPAAHALDPNRLLEQYIHAGWTDEQGYAGGAGDLRLAVRDSGRGIDERVLRSGREGHWGLVGMRECAEKMGAHLKVRSHAGGGTELDLTVPGHIAFATPESARTPQWLSRFVRRPRAEARPPKVPPTG